MTTTIHDVARIAGVGIGTVSRVINNNPSVKRVTREKVLAVIHQLNYTPDPIARSMISKRTGSVGVSVPFFTRPFFMEVLQGIEATLTECGRSLILYNIRNDPQRDDYFSDLSMHRKVDGLLVLSISPDEAATHRLQELELPVVLVDAYSSLFTSLVVNNVDGAYQAMMCLIEKGHHYIGFINGIVEGNFKFNQANDRLIGVHRALGEAGIPFDPDLVFATEWNRHGGRKAALQLLSQEKRPTAIFASSDVQAVGVLQAARELNIGVPDDLSIIGYDDIEVAELLGISTIRQPMRQMGEIGVSKLIEQIENPQNAPELIRLNTRLVERSTTAVVPSAH